jgi:hypothetical protein
MGMMNLSKKPKWAQNPYKARVRHGFSIGGNIQGAPNGQGVVSCAIQVSLVSDARGIAAFYFQVID